MTAHRCLSEQDLSDLACGLSVAEGREKLMIRAEECPECSYLLAEAGFAVSSQADDPADTFPGLHDPARLREGEMVAKRYRVLQRLGRGGMGEVYLVQDEELDELVALKTIAAPLATDSKALERFKREVRLARKVHHENVCRVFEFGRHTQPDGLTIYYLTMVYLRGQTLRERMRRCASHDERWVLRVAAGLARGLQAIHDAGILHRDVKPDNVMLVETGSEGVQPELLDFGIARQETPETGVGVTVDSRAVVGTLDYMAPEQLESETLTVRSDLYSLGVLMYQALTGHLPFEGKTGMNRAVKKLKGEPLPPRHWVPSLSEEANSIVTWCLKREPTQRPATARQLAHQIESALSDARPKRMSQPGPLPTTWRVGALSSRTTWVAIALFAGGLAVIGASFHRGESERRSRSEPFSEGKASLGQEERFSPKLPDPVLQPKPPVRKTPSVPKSEAVAPPPSPRISSASPNLEPQTSSPTTSNTPPESSAVQPEEEMHEDALLDPFDESGE